MDRRSFLLSTVATLAAFGSGASLAFINRFELSQTLAEGEHQRTIAALKPPKRTCPVIAVVLDEHGSETTDALVPFGVLSRSGLADVQMVCAQTDPVDLFPALTVRPQISLERFDKRHPEGADFVIVPACHRLHSSPIIPWVQNQAAGGATIIGICAGAKTLAVAGLLSGKRATTHWYELDHLRRLEPSMTYVPNRRYVADGPVVTTTGVTASLPLSLALVEAMGGRSAAEKLADELGASGWCALHDSSAFRTTRQAVLTALANRMSFRRGIGIPVSDGTDEIALAFTADAWSRTYRSAAFTVADQRVVMAKSGLEIIVDRLERRGLRMVDSPPLRHPATAMDETLVAIEQLLGHDTAAFVALQLEYPS
ncbi:MAG: DJ-1/PfpI family protein [Parvularcula sp.]|jgi:putative intracellular protease/amidase|nr:DJ-1/PfpI family protein [Parvularcula sp.]